MSGQTNNDLTARMRVGMHAALSTGRIGTPVATRLIDCGCADSGQVEARLACGLETAAAWLRSDIIRLAALRSAAGGHITALALCRQGQMMLVSAGVRGQSRPLVEAMVVGNHGIASWEPDAARGFGGDVYGVQLSADAAQLLALVRRSLDTGDAVAPGDPGPSPPRQTATSADSSLPRRAPPINRPDPPWGVLLVAGNQTHQENYARSLAADRRCRLVGLTDAADITLRRRKLNARLASELSIPYFDDLAAALSRDDVHIVSICAEPERRGPIIVQAARAAKHLYLDKPLAATAEEAAAIVAAIEHAGVGSHMFSMWPSPVARRLKAIHDAGTVGDLAAIHADLFFAKGHAGGTAIETPRVESAAPTLFEAIESKRELYNIGVYPLVNLAALTGRAIRRVFALTGNYFFAENAANDMEDFGAMLIELDGGRQATVMAGRTGWHSHPAGGVNRSCLAGARGVATIDAFGPRAEIWDGGEPWTAPARHPEDPMGMWSSTTSEGGARPKHGWHAPGAADWSDAAYFLDCLEQRRASDVSANLAAEVLRTQLAAYRSAASGQFASLE
jgi:myo-inositol 2-dehydrogenase / D-chiro-inositol 1-dehydrogenase